MSKFWGALQLVVVGDSFTAAESVQTPYWQGITPSTLSLGIPGTGAVEQALALREFGLPRLPRVVVMAYYEGNDLGDNWYFQQARVAGETVYSYGASKRPWDYLVTYQLLTYLQEIAPPKQEAGEEECAFPVEDIYGHQLAFLGLELALSTIDADSLRNSEVFAMTRDTIVETAESVHTSGAVFVLAFIPHKAHVYWDGLVQGDQIWTISPYTGVFIPTSEGLVIDETRRTPEQIAKALVENMDVQRELLAELAAEHGFLFLDFTPRFQEIARSEHQPLYFYGDTHWNQRGHDLARTVLRDSLIEHDLLDLEN